MLEAMSTGDGSLCTLHARTAGHAIDRLVTLCMNAGIGISDAFAYRLVAQAVDLVVHITLLDETAIGGGRHRYVSQVLELNGIGEANRPALTTVFAPGPDGRAVPAHHPACLDDLVRAGFDAGLLDHARGLWPARLDHRGRRPVLRGAAMSTPSLLAALAGALTAGGLWLAVLGLQRRPVTDAGTDSAASGLAARWRRWTAGDPRRPALGRRVAAVALARRRRGRGRWRGWCPGCRWRR